MKDAEIIVCHGNAKPNDLQLISQEVAMDEEIIAGSTLRQMAPRGQQANVLACRIRQPKEGDMAQREQKGQSRGQEAEEEENQDHRSSAKPKGYNGALAAERRIRQEEVGTG
jgi:hypothetical protein